MFWRPSGPLDHCWAGGMGKGQSGKLMPVYFASLIRESVLGSPQVDFTLAKTGFHGYLVARGVWEVSELQTALQSPGL